MSVVDRVKNICLTPNTEWAVIAQEAASPASLITGYVVPLAAIGAVAGFIGGSLLGRSLPYIGTYRVPFATGLGIAVFTFVMAIVGVFILSLIINALAPSFGGQKDSTQALKVAVYSYTPAWVAAVFNILPFIGILAIIGAFYGFYLLYLGLPRLMKSPPDKAAGYTVVVVVCAIVLSAVIGATGGMVVGAGAIGAGVLGGAAAGGPASGGEVRFDKDSALGKLQQLGKAMEQSSNKIDEAAKRGDANGQAAAALEGLGTLFSGGKHVEPIAIDQLKPFVPETFAGLPKKSSKAEKTGIASLMVSKAEATYGDDAGKQVTLEVSDTGGASGLMSLASWAGIQEEKEDDYGSERTQKVGGRLVHEKSSKRGGSNEFGIVLGDRFVVSASSAGVGLSELKAAVTGLDLGKLEAMKEVGVTK
jgi:hypothetical protein